MSEFLNGKELAAKLGFSETYVLAMKRAGYEFELPGNRTTIEHALSWLRPLKRRFVARHYLQPGWEKLPKLTQADARLTVVGAGK